MGTIVQGWNVIPDNAFGNKNAIFFAISDNYSFAVANVIMSLNKWSNSLMGSTDIIIYHDGISEKNVELLQSLHKNTYFLYMQFPEEWTDIVNHPRTAPWGPYVICKFFGFELIKKYEKVLHLDADIHICADIKELFDFEDELIWREILGWKPNEIFVDLITPGTEIKCGNGGMILFSNKILKYHIDKDTIKKAFLDIEGLKDGGIDETVIAWIVYQKGIQTRELDMHTYNTPSRHVTLETKLVHFLDSLSISSKPWKNPASYLYYEDWAENYQKWIEIGGEGLVHFTKEDYYQLFAYDKEIKIRKLNKKLKITIDEKQECLNTIEKLSKEVHGYLNEIQKISMENKKLNSDLRKKDESIFKLKAQLDKILGSKSWKMTKPFRILVNFCKKLLRSTHA